MMHSLMRGLPLHWGGSFVGRKKGKRLKRCLYAFFGAFRGENQESLKTEKGQTKSLKAPFCIYFGLDCNGDARFCGLVRFFKGHGCKFLCVCDFLLCIHGVCFLLFKYNCFYLSKNLRIQS